MRSIRQLVFAVAPVALALLVPVLVLGCGGGSSSTPTTPASDTLTLTSITPVTSTVLHNGTTVQFSARMSYSMANSTTGRLSVIVLAGTTPVLTDPVIPFANLTQRTGEATLNFSIDVNAPTTRQITLTFGLFPGSTTTATAVVTASYAAGP